MARCAYTNVDFARIFILTTDGAIFSCPNNVERADVEDYYYGEYDYTSYATKT